MRRCACRAGGPTTVIPSRRIANRLLLCTLFCLASTLTVSPVNAEEATRGWVDRILKLFDRSEDEAAAGPDHGTPAETSHAAVPPVAPERPDAAQRPSARTSVEFPERRPGMTPPNAYQAVQDVIAEIDVLREELGVDDFPPEAELMDDRSPIHVYAKSLEVLEKVISVQQRMDIPPGRVGRIPFRPIDAADIVTNLEYILGELREIKAWRGIDRVIEPASLELDRSYSMSYMRLSDASFMLDALRGQPLTTDDVYRVASWVLDEMVPIGEKLDATLNFEAPPVAGRTKPIDVARQVARATYKMVHLQIGLQMAPSGVPATTLVRMSPSEQYDAFNMLLAEIARIKLHLGVDVLRDDLAEQPTGKKTKDVLVLTVLIVQNLDSLVFAASR